MFEIVEIFEKFGIKNQSKICNQKSKIIKLLSY